MVDLLDHNRAVELKRQRQQTLAEALAGPVEHEAVDEELTRRVGAVVERLRELEGEAEPPVDPFTATADAKAERQQALMDALRVRTPRDTRGRFVPAAADFHRGAREPVPPSPETHEQTLVSVLRSREADVGPRL